MRCINKMRPGMVGLLVLLCGCLTGCSVSFCGFRGKGEEFVFVCQEETAEQEKTVPEVVSQAAADPQKLRRPRNQSLRQRRFPRMAGLISTLQEWRN